MELVIIGIALLSFNTLFGVFISLWDRFTIPILVSKKKNLIFVVFVLILFALSCLIGYETYRLIGHGGKDKDEPLKGYVEYMHQFDLNPSCVIYDSKVYMVSNCKPDLQIVLCNTNDLDLIINSIDMIIDDYIDETLIIYNTTKDLWKEEKNMEYPIFFGNVYQNERKTRLLYWGIGDPENNPSDYDKDISHYAKMKANSHDVVVPYSSFSRGGLYTIHYVVNYSLNGHEKQLILPQVIIYISKSNNPLYFIYHYHWKEIVGWNSIDMDDVIEKGMHIHKDNLDLLLSIEDWYEDYIPYIDDSNFPSSLFEKIKIPK